MPDEASAETNSSSGESPAGSFQDRMRQRLSAERTSAEPTGAPEGYDDEANRGDDDQSDDKVGDGYEDALDSARQAEGDEETGAIEEEPTGEIDDKDAAVSENSEDDPDEEQAGETVPDDINELTRRAEDAEKARADMERDYRIKTHKIASATRALEDDTTVVKQQAEFILGIAQQGVAQFDNVNWTALQSTPEEYQRTRQMFNQAVQQRDQLQGSLGKIAENHKAMLDQAKDREAAVSKDILKSTVKGWNNELYGTLRGYAVEELSYTLEEFDEMTDWRRLRDIHAQHQIFTAPKKVTTVRRKKGKQPVRRQRERKTGQPRNKGGEFASARQAFQDNPGPGPERRNFFQQKLAAERRR